MDKTGLHRRSFLRAGAVVSAAAATGKVAAPESAEARTYNGKTPWQPREADSPEPLQSANYLYLTPPEVRFVTAATERLIPHDELGPGASEAGVTLFIDHQLAGAYGRASSWYMQGPWAKGAPTQGFQSRMGPADLYRAAIKAIDAHVAGQIKQTNNTPANSGNPTPDKVFADLPPDQQDALLKQMEEGKLDLAGVDAKTFFKLLWQNTKEGMFSDPLYGGNKDMAGWKMIGFPGARYDYTEWVAKPGVRYTLPPVGIMGRKDWTPQKS